MKLKQKKATRERMLKHIEKGEGRIGVKDIPEILNLVSEEKLLEAFFSIILKLEYQLKANFHNKFHVDWKKVRKQEPQPRDIKKLWEEFSKKFDKFYAIIFISYSTKLIGKLIYDRLNKLRDLRNQIAHNLTYYEPEIFVTKKEVKSGVNEGIKLLTELQKYQTKIIKGK